MMYSLVVFGMSCLAVVHAINLERCGGKPADVFFLLDSSGSLSFPDFQKELDFTKEVVSMFDTSENNVRVGVATFSKHVTPHVALGQYSNQSDLLNKISAILYEGMGTNTGEALGYLHVQGMSRSNTREDLPHIAIILTDGMSQNPSSTLHEAVAVHMSGITVFVIGVGNQVDALELEAIASKPSDKYVYRIDSFDALKKIQEELAIKACEVEPIPPAFNIQNTEAAMAEELMNYGRCTPRNNIDIVFAVDTAAVGASNTEFVLRFIGNVSDHINMQSGGVSIATLSNGCSGGVFDEDVSYDPEGVKTELSKFKSPKFPTMLRNMRLKAVDGRQDAKHVGTIFIIDPLSSIDFRFAQKERRRAMYKETEIFVIGVGNRVNESQAKQLATDKGGYIHVYDFDSLETVVMKFLLKMCIIGV